MKPLKKSISLLSISLLLLLTTPHLYAESHRDDHRTILILGDSLSAAHGIDLEQGWPQLLDNYLSETHQPDPSTQGQTSRADAEASQPPSTSSLPANATQPPPSYSVVNASISGDTTGGGLRRLPELLNTHQPYLVIIELGGNDGLRGYPINSLRNNLSEMVRLSQQSGAKVLLAGMRIPPNYGPRYTQQFFASYQLIAKQYKTALIPFLLDGIALDPALMQRDGIHPNAKAQRLILQNVLPVLKPLL